MSFTLVPGDSNLIDPLIYLPSGGNYLTFCKDFKVTQCMPNLTNPTQCVMTCKCPKIMDDSNIKYYPASIKYNIKDKVSTSNDGRLYIEENW